MLRTLLLLAAVVAAGGDFAQSVLQYAAAAASARKGWCAPPVPSPATAYLCGLANATAWPACPQGIDCATTWPYPGPFSLVPPGFRELQVRTAGYPQGMPAGATSCTLFLSPQEGASLQLAFKSFRINSHNFFSVQEWASAGTFYPAKAPYLLGAASGSTLPPTVRSGPGNGLALTYYAPEVDQHDPGLCDGVVAVASVVPAAPSLSACARATTCGACASTAGCVWCDTSDVSGACLYTGVGAAPLGGAPGTPTFFTLPPSPQLASAPLGTNTSGQPGMLCNASLAVTSWTACPSARDLQGTAAAAAARAMDAVLTGLAAAYPADVADVSLSYTAATSLPAAPVEPGAASWAQALSPSAPPPFAASTALANSLVTQLQGAPYSAAVAALLRTDLAALVLARYAFVAVLVLFLVFLALCAVVVQWKRAAALRTGNAVKWFLEVTVMWLCLCKALEFVSLALALSFGVGDLPSAMTTPDTLKLLLALATYAADAQYIFIVLVAYNTTPTVPNSKHSLCACGCVLLPSLVVAIITAVLTHYSRESLVLPALTAGSPLGPPLSVQVCYVALPASSITGAPAVAAQPVHMSLALIGSAFLFFASALSTQTFSLLSIASEDLITTLPLHFRPPLVKALGSILCLLSLPMEVVALWTVRCLGLGQSAQNLLASAHLVPAVFLLLGVAVVFAGVVWQVRIDASALPMTVKEGLRLNVPREAEEDGQGSGNKASAEVRPAGAGAAGVGGGH